MGLQTEGGSFSGGFNVQGVHFLLGGGGPWGDRVITMGVSTRDVVGGWGDHLHSTTCSSDTQHPGLPWSPLKLTDQNLWGTRAGFKNSQARVFLASEKGGHTHFKQGKRGPSIIHTQSQRQYQTHSDTPSHRPHAFPFHCASNSGETSKSAMTWLKDFGEFSDFLRISQLFKDLRNLSRILQSFIKLCLFIGDFRRIFGKFQRILSSFWRFLEIFEIFGNFGYFQIVFEFRVCFGDFFGFLESFGEFWRVSESFRRLFKQCSKEFGKYKGVTESFE